MIIKHLNKKQKIGVIVGVVLLFVAGASYYVYNKSKEPSAEQMVALIREMEAKQPPKIGKTPTYYQIYESPYIQHIRIALKGYLDGTNNGVEESALTNESSGDMNCGLKNFDKDTYKGKFVVVKALDNDYGGVQANIVFINNPKIVFWVWMYQYGTWDSESKTGEYVLRAFCEEDVKDEYKPVIQEIMKGMIKDNKEYYSL